MARKVNLTTHTLHGPDSKEKHVKRNDSLEAVILKRSKISFRKVDTFLDTSFRELYEFHLVSQNLIHAKFILVLICKNKIFETHIS